MVKRPTAQRVEDENGNDDDNGDEAVTVRKIDPLIRSLLGHLPRSGEVWSMDDRNNWMNLLEGAFKVIYKEPTPKPEPSKPGAPGAPTPAGRPV